MELRAEIPFPAADPCQVLGLLQAPAALERIALGLAALGHVPEHHQVVAGNEIGGGAEIGHGSRPVGPADQDLALQMAVLDESSPRSRSRPRGASRPRPRPASRAAARSCSRAAGSPPGWPGRSGVRCRRRRSGRAPSRTPPAALGLLTTAASVSTISVTSAVAPQRPTGSPAAPSQASPRVSKVRTAPSGRTILVRKLNLPPDSSAASITPLTRSRSSSCTRARKFT